MRPARFANRRRRKEQVRTQFVSGDAFDRLGVAPAAGRLITPQDDDRPGAHPVAVLSHAFWMRRFGGDPAIVGRWFTLERSLQFADRRRGRSAIHRRRAGPRRRICGCPTRCTTRGHLATLDFNWFRDLRPPEGQRPGRSRRRACCRRRSPNFRRDRTPGARTERIARERRAVRRHAAVRAVGGQRPVAAAPPVRAPAVDSGLDRGAGAAHRRRRTSRTCSWRGPQRASTRWRCACRSARAAAG